MRPTLKSLDLDPDPSKLSSDPADFVLIARMMVGPLDALGEESFDVTVCTAEWLAGECRRVGGIYNARHHLVVDAEAFNQRGLTAWLTEHVQNVQGDTWSEIGEGLGRLGRWEFEDYRP